MDMLSPRHYLHGDPLEGEPLRYYCSLHDVFEFSEHFQSKQHAGNLKLMRHEQKIYLQPGVPGHRVTWDERNLFNQ